MKSERYIFGRWLGLIVLSVFIFHFSLLPAQPRLRTPEIYFGVHGGVSASSIIFSPSTGTMTPITNASILGGTGGFVFRYAGHKYCAVQVELNYEQRGWAEKNSAGQYTRRLHYVELPLLMNINFGSERWRGFFNLGPQIGYCVWDDGGKGTQISTELTHYNPIELPFDWGLAGGLGFYYRSRHAGVYQFEARFDYSFGGIYNTRPIDHFTMANPMDLSLHLAWLWEFKKKNRK